MVWLNRSDGGVPLIQMLQNSLPIVDAVAPTQPLEELHAGGKKRTSGTSIPPDSSFPKRKKMHNTAPTKTQLPLGSIINPQILKIINQFFRSFLIINWYQFGRKDLRFGLFISQPFIRFFNLFDQIDINWYRLLIFLKLL